MSSIEGLDMGQMNKLRNLLSYLPTPQAAYFSGRFGGGKKYLIDKRGRFPTGLLYLVKDWLDKENLSSAVTITDIRVKPAPTARFNPSLGVTPYREQIEASKACQTLNRGIISASTGVGKSLIAALIVIKLQVRTLIVVPSLELKRQLTESFKKWFGKEVVGGLGHAIAVENVDALDPNDVRKDYDCVIIDEFHHSGAKTYRKLNQKAWNNIFYRFGLTATPFRSQDNERLLLESVLSEVIYRIDYEKAVSAGYIVPVEAYYLDIPQKRVSATTWPEVYSKLVVNNLERNEIIVDLLERCRGQTTLCLVKEIRHGEILSEMSGVPFANGQNEDSRKYIEQFKQGEIDRLIGTTGVIGEGVDTKPCEYVIIAGLGKSKNAIMQQIGRGVRKHKDKESCKVILFRDNSHKFTKSHFATEKKILLDEFQVKITRLDI